MSTLVLHSSRKETGLFIDALASTLRDETKKKFEEYAVLTKLTSFNRPLSAKKLHSTISRAIEMPSYMAVPVISMRCYMS